MQTRYMTGSKTGPVPTSSPKQPEGEYKTVASIQFIIAPWLTSIDYERVAD